MATEKLPQTTQDNGPSGFMQLIRHLLVVDHGKIFLDGNTVGIFFDDGLIKPLAEPFDTSQGIKTIEELPGCTFKGIDGKGVVMELPSPKAGPTGLLKYNGVALNVLHGRIAKNDHVVLGSFNDQGKITLRSHKDPSVSFELDDYSQLSTWFQGVNTRERPMMHEWVRPLHKMDKSYRDNEIIRYFEDYDKLSTIQKSYVLETMQLWAGSGILQIIRRTEGDCAMGNVKHGASGVTGVRTGKVTLDKEEFEREITLYRQFGSIARIPSRVKQYHEVRINLVVSHEFGHQLEFTMSQACQDKVIKNYDDLLKRCKKLHPLPEDYEGFSELLQLHQIEERVFISGYSRASFHEYWAEAVAAFSVKGSREVLKAMDPFVHDMLMEIVYSPETTLSPKLAEDVLKLQASLKVGGEFTDDLFKT